MSEEVIRKIIHIDMDAFFASVEQKDQPELKGKAIAVGGGGDRGVVAAASYEARKFGVRSAMPSKSAIKRCPHLIFVTPRHARYKEISNQIMAIFHEYTDLVEPLSIDEAFLDVTHNKKGLSSATAIAEEIRKQIKEETGLTASAGISVNKFLAKIASDYQKPDGLFVVKPKMVESFIEKLSIEKFFGVGKVTADKMHKIGIFHGKDLKKRSLLELTRLFGKNGVYYYNIARGIDQREVNPNRIRKSVSTENTFLDDIRTKEALKKRLEELTLDLHRRLQKAKFKGRTISLKIKYSNFEQITRSKTVFHEIVDYDEILELSSSLLSQLELVDSVRLLGIGISNQIKPNEIIQLTFDF
ncbi:DNA polymerase IV [Ancylomarina sp. 16SWW S1-10-2]|uniref:DNA polymerase IV n=1 Tax=Ancylomarina sp. 16SWW S1-10-2 TaxID=2499681 RepID=UPI0012AEA213|nr:DNA polymerase IV [Ancylomarina sp. 16SWW S1-10-2]MRT93099.1 DNA polymerase IV [Ancylomarina sp. 16SWW S1-10-2]